MAVIFTLLIIIYLYKTKFYINKFNDDYLKINNTTTLNGLFIVLVFFSHFFSYYPAEIKIDIYLYKIISYIGQLMVTSFLFFSGYGIFESIKNKKNYIDTFIKKRFIPTYMNFVICVLLFVIVNIIIKNSITLNNFLLSLIGYSNIGNSNWYMFSIFILYIITYISFKFFKNHKKSLILLSIFSCAYIIIISFSKESFWYNTLLCYPFGLWYSYFKERIDKLLSNNKNYIIIFFCNILLLLLIKIINHYIFLELGEIYGGYFYNLFSICFIYVIVLLMKKMEFKSIFFNYLGKNVFLIYILQRIPMILLNKIDNIILKFVLCGILTLLLTEIVKRTVLKYTKLYRESVK